MSNQLLFVMRKTVTRTCAVLSHFSCLTLCNPMDCSLPGFSVRGVLQARTLEWVAMPSPRGSSRPRDWTCSSCASCTAGRFFTIWDSWEAPHTLKAMVFPVVMYRCESCLIKKAEYRRIDAFELWCWRRFLSPVDCTEIKPVNPKGNQPWIFIGKTDAEAEAPIL